MTKQQQNRLVIIGLFAMTIIPFVIAWYLASNRELVSGAQTNYGRLINPPITIDKTELIGFDEFSNKNMRELQGRWVLTLAISQTDCNRLCLETIHKTKQLWMMLNRDLTRVRRLAVVFNEIPVARTESWWQWDCQKYEPVSKTYSLDDTCKITLLRAKANDKLVAKFKQIKDVNLTDGMLFLIDPLGNMMMYYEPDFDPYKVVKDLKKLLANSQIG